MPLSKNEASEALRDIAKTGSRSSTAYLNEKAAPFLILWGVLWIIGYSGTDLLDDRLANQLWAAVDIFGILASLYVGLQRKRGVSSPPIISRHWLASTWSWAVSFLALAGFVVAAATIMIHPNGAQIGALIPLVVAVVYVIAGVWNSLRFLIMGLIIAALTLGGYFYMHEHFALLMATVGGGALILGGLWMRQA